jgi:hypothetical protein
MSDIVERLRHEEPFCQVCADLRQSASEEIERLRAVKSAEEIERLQFILNTFRDALKDIAIGPGSDAVRRRPDGHLSLLLRLPLQPPDRMSAEQWGDDVRLD